MERKKARTAGRSALAQRFAAIEATLTGRGSQGDGYGFDDFAEHGFGGLRFFLERGVAGAGHHAMGEDGDGELLEIVGQAEIATIEECAGLRGALQHQSATRADAERKLLRFSGAGDN